MLKTGSRMLRKYGIKEQTADHVRQACLIFSLSEIIGFALAGKSSFGCSSHALTYTNPT